MAIVMQCVNAIQDILVKTVKHHAKEYVKDFGLMVAIRIFQMLCYMDAINLVDAVIRKKEKVH
jgi:hypothetical protein